MDIIITPEECKKLVFVKLPRPKNGEAQQFLYDEENLCLYETIKFSDEFRSWFIDNSFCRDGHFNMLTKIDPLFIFLQQLMKFTRENYRPLNDICQEFSTQDNAEEQWSRLDFALTPYINWDSICDTKDIDGEMFVRYNESKSIDWLARKHSQLMETLKAELPSNSSKATLISYALDLLDDYVPESLSKKFKETVRSKHIVGSNNSKTVEKTSIIDSFSHPKQQTGSKRATPSEPVRTKSTKEIPKNSVANFFKKKT